MQVKGFECATFNAYHVSPSKVFCEGESSPLTQQNLAKIESNPSHTVDTT
jgi:hypothetical protein